jgi:hypothetical protein
VSASLLVAHRVYSQCLPSYWLHVAYVLIVCHSFTQDQEQPSPGFVFRPGRTVGELYAGVNASAAASVTPGGTATVRDNTTPIIFLATPRTVALFCVCGTIMEPCHEAI